MKVINILGGPGIGKSTAAAKIFCNLKERGLSAELVTEVAKDIVYDEQLKILKDQLFVFAKQNRRIERLRDKVDYVVTDSPGILALAYQPEDYYSSFEQFVVDVFKSYENINFFLDRYYHFDSRGRAHSEDESKTIDGIIMKILEKHNIPFYRLGPDPVSHQIAIDRILHGES